MRYELHDGSKPEHHPDAPYVNDNTIGAGLYLEDCASRLNSQDAAITALIRAYAALYGDHHAGGHCDPSYRASAEAEGKRKAQEIANKDRSR